MVQSTTFSTPGATTYTVPSGVDTIEIELTGPGGGSSGFSAAAGGAGGYLVAQVDVTPGETLDVYVGGGGDAGSGQSGGAGGAPTWNSGGDGGNADPDAGGGGGGGGVSAIVDSGGAVLGTAAGGGGGPGYTDTGTNAEGGGGGGGARGGVGGTSVDNADGQDGSGSGVGGDGGEPGSTNSPGGDGGTTAVAGASVSISTTGGGAAGGATVTGTNTGNAGGDGKVIIRESPRAPSPSIDATTNTTVDLSWTDVSDEDNYTVEYREQGTSTWTVFSTPVAGATSETVTALTEGTAYEFRVGATNAAGTSYSGTLTTTTVLPAPTFDSLTLQNGDELVCAWTDNAIDEDGYRVMLSTDGGSSYTQANGDLAPNTTSYTTAEQRDGEQYTVKIRAFTADTTSDSGTLQTTTVLPDISGVVVDSFTEDEITVSYADTIDYGSYRVQLRETGEGQAWGAVADLTAGQDTLSITATGLEDGEQYDVRARTETEHVTGTYVTDTATTVLPAPGNVATASVGTNSVGLSWTDTADNEDGIRVKRRREYADGFGPQQTLADLAPNSTSYTDSSTVPGTTYDYEIENYTEHVTAASTLEVTTTAGAPTDAPSESGWYVELTASDGSVRTFTSDGDPERDPSLKDLERVTLTVGKDSTLDADKWTDATARVWQDGYRLPVDTLIQRRQRPGETELVIEGPAELYETGSYEFSNTDAHAALGTVLGDTSLSYTITSPDASNREFDTVTTDADFGGYYEDPGPNTNVGVPNDALEPLQSNFWFEAEDDATSGVTANANFPGGDPQWSNATAADLTVSGILNFNVTPDYTIPSGRVTIVSRLSTDSFTGDLVARIDGTEVSRLRFNGSSITSTLQEHTAGLAGGITSDIPTSGSTVTVDVESDDTGSLSGSLYLDGTAVYDSAHHDHTTWSMSTWDTNEYYNDPPLYDTDGTNAVLLHDGFLSATGAEFDATFSDTTGDQGIALSNDYGATYQTCANCSLLSATFASPGPDIQARVTLDAYGSRETATPLQNYQGQALTEYVLNIDTRDSPPLTNDQFSGNLYEILTALAERGNILWAAEWDRDTQQIQISVSNVSDLTSARDLDVVDYEWDTQTLGRQITWATIEGGAQSVRQEGVTADTVNGNSLTNADLIPGREQVSDANTGQIYTRGTDYEVQYTLGNLNFPGGTNISNGQALEVSYEWKPDGEFAIGAADEKTRIRETFVGASTDAICRGVAYYIVQTLKDPVIGGTATVDDVPPALSLLDIFAADPLPTDVTDDFYVNSASVREGQVTIDIQSRRATSELVSQINNALWDVQDRV